MKSIIAVLSVLQLCVCSMKVFSQSANVMVRAHIEKLPEGAWVYYCGLASKWDSVQSADGNFKVAFFIPPGRGDLYTFTLQKYVANFIEGKSLSIYLEGPADVLMKGNGNDFNNIRFSGHGSCISEQDHFITYVSAGMPQLKPFDTTEAKTADSAGKVVLAKKFIKTYNEKMKQRSGKYLQWIKNHPDSRFSTALLYSERWIFTSDSLRLYTDLLTQNAKNNIPGRLLADVVYSQQEGIRRARFTKLDTSSVLAIGKPAPNFTQTDTTGNPVSLSDFRGKYVLLNFWGSWCHWCRLENPAIVAGFNQYKDANFTVVSVGEESSKENWMKAIHQDKTGGWTQVSDLTQSGKNAVAKLYKIKGYPSSFLIDPDGKLLYSGLGESAVDTIFHRMLPKLLKK